jgi:endo-beta-N-acetylglucosaminidase D
MRGPSHRPLCGSLLLATAGVGLLVAGPAGAVSADRPFASPIAAGHVSVSCKPVGKAAARLRIAAQVGYSDVVPGLERRLRGRRHRGAVALRLTTLTGRRLARVEDSDALQLGFDRDRIHHSHTAVLGRRAGRRVLRYARGTRRCRARPNRNRRVRVVVRARQRLSAPRGRASTPSRTQSARLRQHTSVVAAGPSAVSTCPPYPCFGKAADLLAWDPSSARPFDVASVPLARRVESPDPGMLVGFDNGPWSYWSDFDLNAQGSALTGNVYNFSHWQYLDSLYYYYHQLVSVPPTVWVNAAHRNGVTALGTVTADCSGCDSEMRDLFEAHGDAAVDQLQQLAATYGFDGWIIDVENGVTLSAEIIAAMRELALRPLPSGRRVQVVYYQAGSFSLADDIYPALQAAGSWQSDYVYEEDRSSYPEETYGFLAQQAPPATGLRYDAHWATNVYGAPPYSPVWNQPADACGSTTSASWLFNGRRCLHIATMFANLGSARAPTDPPAFFQSLALYAPDWTMYGGLEQNTDPRSPPEVFHAVDELLWAGAGGYAVSGTDCRLAQPGQNSVSALVEPRSVLTRVPFFTRFNTGEGSDFIVEGEDTFSGSWNLLGAQDGLPMEQCREGSTLVADIDYDEAYDGGSALRVSGTATPGAQRIYLYEADAPLPQQPGFTLRYQLPAGAAAPHVVVWIDGQGPIDLQPATSRSDGTWTYARAQLPASVAPGKLTRIGVGFDVSADQQIDVLIGELGVVDLASYTPPEQITPPPPSAGTLSWRDTAAPTTQYYNVWAVPPGESCVQFAGRSMLPIYDLDHPLFAIPGNAQRFIVQPVSTSGLASPLSPSPCRTASQPSE